MRRSTQAVHRTFTSATATRTLCGNVSASPRPARQCVRRASARGDLFPNSVTFDAGLRAAGIEKVDAEGRVVDFHALRTTFISWLGMTGVHPRMAQALARHASIETTLGTYTDLRLFDSKGAVANLPLPETARPESSAASA